MAREDAAIAALERVIERQGAVIDKLTDQLIRLTTPQMIQVNPSSEPLWFSEEDEDKRAREAFEGDDTSVDFNDPGIREILHHAGALSTDIAVAE